MAMAVLAARTAPAGPRLCFVGTRSGNHFLTELLEAVAGASADAGARVSFAFDGYPRFDDPTVYVVIPHEFFTLVPEERWPDAHELQRTISLCVEMPGTKWFETTATHAPRTAAVLAINKSATNELRRRGIAAEHIQLGYWRGWDGWQGDPTRTRPFDVLYMGTDDVRRGRVLSGFGEVLQARRTSIFVPPEAPKKSGRPDFLTGAQKYERLGSAKVLLNLHRCGSSSLEWIRVLESIVNGCVVVSEHSRDHGPLVPGEHFFSARAESLGLLADHLLDDPARLAQVRKQAYEFVRGELRMEPTVARMIDLAADLVRSALPAPRGRSAPQRLVPAPVPPEIPSVPTPAMAELARLRSGLKHLVTQNLETRRLLHSMRRIDSEDWDEDGVRLVASTRAAAEASPRLSVAMPLYNQAREVVEALQSLLASDFDDYEVLVYDDASTDDGPRDVERLFAEHPWMAGRLFQGRVNAGPSRGRNMLAARARGELIFMLDADNKVHPNTLGRLVEALDRNPEASFVYPIIAVHTGSAPVGLLSALPWEPARLAAGNYIDAMALWRREALLAMGGYCEDTRLQGWEDYDLWCRCAEEGRSGVLVPEILGWYRKTEHSTLALTNIDLGAVSSLIRERSPSVFPLPPQDVVPAPRAVPAILWSRPGQPTSDTARRWYPEVGRIAIFGQYKTGTTALFYLVRNSLPAGTRTLFEPKEYRHETGDDERLVLAKVILGLTEEPEAVRYDTFTGFDRKLFIVRDPRDWLVSATVFLIQQEGDVYENEATLAAVMALLRQKERDPHSVPLVDILDRILTAKPGRSLGEILRQIQAQYEWVMQFEGTLNDRHRVRYEDVVSGHIGEIESYLQIPLVGTTAVDDAHGHVPRTKGHGDWHHWFTETDVRVFEPVFAAYMQRYGYDVGGWDLSDHPVIEPRHCTEYVERVVKRRKLAKAGANAAAIPSEPRLIVDPYLHIDAQQISSPLTGRTLRGGETTTLQIQDLREGKGTADALPAPVKRRLVEQGWLVDARTNLESRFTLRYVSLEAHTVCNQACYFCPVSVDPRSDHYMPTEMYEDIVRQLAAYRETIETVFMINYNEPTADARFVEQVRTLKSNGLPPAVLTNGTGLTPARVDALEAMGGLRFLSINLSTLDRERYQRERGGDHLPLVLRNLDYAKDHRLAEQMDIVVLGENDEKHQRDFEEIRERFNGSHFAVKSFHVMDRAGRLPTGRKPPSPHGRLCGCDNVGSRPLEHLHITPQGKCVLCCEDYDEKYVIGDLTHQTVAEVLTGSEIGKMRRWAYGLEEAPADFICRQCVFARSQ